ncbi:MAG: BA14K family protein [Mesorhizobium sp.]|uniref:BA14K family protein n=1 Tax=Mesorhizobium sp. TaxID=1871066 RepID=UPI0011FE6EC6|nr:BA14K family protein [Mesorhizobium sp.]TIL95732.1 MAG: BA14K family protein [Mesorhizobium sp.]
MKPLFLTTIRSGMLTLGLVSGLSAPSMAGPIQPDVPLPTAAAAREIVPVRESWAGGNNNVWMRGRNFSRNWNRGNWNRGNWNGGRHWRRNWNGGRHWRHNRGRYYGGSNYGRYYGGGYYGRYYDDDDGAAALLGLGLGFGLGSLYQGYYNQGYYNRGYYNQGYYNRGYYNNGSSAHVRWCYNRYRSYRTWDNTFQPYNGPRRQCWSPYR